jgi:hypothetical protein
VRLNAWQSTCFGWGQSVLTACHRFTGFLKLSSAEFGENQKCSSFLRCAGVPGDRCIAVVYYAVKLLQFLNCIVFNTPELKEVIS